jgi:transposase
MSRQSGAGNGVQDTRSGGNQAAQGTVLSGTSRRRVRAVVCYDEKPGIQAIATTAPDLPPEPGIHATLARDHEYKRHGTLSLLAGIDLLTGKVHALVRDRHRSREFIEFLRLLDAAYPASTAIKLILDNHSAHISKETRSWLATRPTGRFEFTFTPTAKNALPVEFFARVIWQKVVSQ